MKMTCTCGTEIRCAVVPFPTSCASCGRFYMVTIVDGEPGESYQEWCPRDGRGAPKAKEEG